MKPVPAEIIWLPSEDPSFIVQHLKEFFDAELLIDNEPLHSSEDEESYVTVFGKLKLQKSNFELLINKWCGQEVGKHQMLLSLHKEIELDTCPSLDDKWIDVDNMSFGTMIELNKFAEHYSTMEQNKDTKLKFMVENIKVYFQHDIKLMSVYFHVAKKNTKAKEESSATCRPHGFEFEYSAIDKILINRTYSNCIDIYLYVSHPPLIYVVELPKDAKNKSYEYYDSPDTTYSRVDTFADCSHSDIGLSTILKLQFSPDNNSWNAICNFILNSKTRLYFSPIFKLPKRKIYESPMITGNQFNCIYALETLLSRSRDVVVQIDERKEISAVNKKLKEFAKENPKALEATLFNILASFEQKKIVNFSNALDVLYHKHDEITKSNICKELSIPKNMTPLRRAILTPTRIIFLPPHLYFKCRFFRDFEPEYTIRLSIKDDDINNLSFTLLGRPRRDNDPGNTTDSSEEHGSNSNEEHENHSNGSYCNSALDRVSVQLKDGFNIGKRNYALLGCSPSHFREHGILFYAKDSNRKNATSARKKMGNFIKIQNTPSRYMARLGQVFSQSIDCINVPKNKVKIEDDITTDSPNKDNPYKFSDGIGKISPSIAQEVFEKLDIKYNPSAIQIRYAGCKGMLTQWPELEDQIIFRESMKKFDSDSESLEILKVSKPRLVFLNRPFITILSQLGVPDEVFLNMQSDNLEKLFNGLFSEEGASKTLNAFSMLRIGYKNIHKAGIKILQEPFFLSMIKNIFEQQVVKLTTKSRIMIPLDKGRTMFGVLDETKTLEYGTVFVQYTEDVNSDNEDAKTKILEEFVLVTKNPCMHAGDVRKFEAVDVKALHHIKDCIVFPAKGHRPHSDEMAGSDLDGDEYSVIWAKELMFKCDNCDPMDFPVVESEELNKETGVAEMVDVFCKYIKGERVGQIATAHLVWADSEKEGIFSERCKNLAFKYSIALDFAKSGKTESLSRDERPDIYPDFLDKGLCNNTYLSKSILGQLYRCSKTVLLSFEGLVCTAKYDADEDFNYPGHENYKKSAEEALCIFNNEIDSILQQYGINSEGELLSGAIMKTSKYISIKQDLNDLLVIEHRIKKLFKEMQKMFCSEFLNNSDVEKIVSLIPLIYGKYKQQVLQKASAWYMVTYEQSMSKKKYLGLPWAIHEILCELKEERKKSKKLSASLGQFEEKMNNMVMESFPKQTSNMVNGRVEVASEAFRIMNDWMRDQPFINNNDKEKEEYDNLLSEIYNQITNDLEKEDCNEKYTIFRILSNCLYKLSCLIFKRAPDCKRSHDSRFLQERRLGFLAFKTLLNIIFRHKFNSLLEADMVSVEEVFRISLSDDIFFCIIHKMEEVVKLLKDWTNVDEIKLRTKSDRKDKWFVLFTVKGNKYALNHFQDIIFQKSFHIAVKRMM